MNKQISIGKKIANNGSMDFSYLLDAPAGKHGFTKVKNGHLFFEDGTRAKFVGFNFAVRSAMPTKETAEILSKRLATMGVNAVRLTAMDAVSSKEGWTCTPGYSIIDYEKETSRDLCDAGVDRLDYWIYQLKSKGIYIHIDLLVARAFLKEDELDYPVDLSSIKSCSHFNDRLIALQKEYAEKFLSHVNPYTGLAIKDETAVFCIQIANEDSVFFTSDRTRNIEAIHFYREELKQRFNSFLIEKYHTRKNLQKAWTFDGVSALQENEDPEKGSVNCILIGEYHQPMNEPMDDWNGKESSPRYADYVEFCMGVNKKYYQSMIDHLKKIGVKVPIATSCLTTGAADTYSHTGGDLMENNAYFNHPAAIWDEKAVYVQLLREFVSSDPRTDTYPDLDHRSNLLTQAAPSQIEGKPYIMSEWNEYGLNPYHSSAFLMTAAYGCLQNWDALLIYCYHTSDNLDDQPENVITNIYDAYNDPSLILQFGVMSAIFLKGLVKEAKKQIDVVYSQNDLLTQPKDHRMPFTVLPFISKVNNIYLEHGEIYRGTGEAALTAGFVSDTNVHSAAHAVVYARSPYINAYRTSYVGSSYLNAYKEPESTELSDGVWVGKNLVFDDIVSLTQKRDYSRFASAVSTSLKKWGIIKENQGITKEDGIRSDTDELYFCPKQSYFFTQAEKCAFFAGKPKMEIILGRRFHVVCKNERISISLLSLDNQDLESSSHLLLTAIGKSGNDETSYEQISEEMTKVTMRGKLYMETLEGMLTIQNTQDVQVRVLDVYGNWIRNLKKETSTGIDSVFLLDGDYYGNFEILFPPMI